MKKGKTLTQLEDKYFGKKGTITRKEYESEVKNDTKQIPSCGCCGGIKNVLNGTCSICRDWANSKERIK